jgi:hypothetical protein
MAVAGWPQEVVGTMLHSHLSVVQPDYEGTCHCASHKTHSIASLAGSPPWSCGGTSACFLRLDRRAASLLDTILKFTGTMHPPQQDVG